MLDNLTRSEMFRAMVKAPSKLDQLRAFREAAAIRRDNAKALRKPPVTESLRQVVTKMGRPTSGNALSPAEKQRAYRQRLKASNAAVTNS